MSMYLFNFFNESKESDHISTILTWLDAKPRFFSTKHLFFKTVKISFIRSNSLISFEIKVRKDQNFQSVSILHKNVNIFIFIF